MMTILGLFSTIIAIMVVAISALTKAFGTDKVSKVSKKISKAL